MIKVTATTMGGNTLTVSVEQEADAEVVRSAFAQRMGILKGARLISSRKGELTENIWQELKSEWINTGAHSCLTVAINFEVASTMEEKLRSLDDWVRKVSARVCPEHVARFRHCVQRLRDQNALVTKMLGPVKT